MSEPSHAPSQHSALSARAWSSPASGWCTPPPQTSASHPLTWQAQDRSGVASEGGRSRQQKPSPLKRLQATHRALPSSVNLLYGKFRPAMTCRSDKHRVRRSGAARRITHVVGAPTQQPTRAASRPTRSRTHARSRTLVRPRRWCPQSRRGARPWSAWRPGRCESRRCFVGPLGRLRSAAVPRPASGVQTTWWWVRTRGRHARWLCAGRAIYFGA